MHPHVPSNALNPIGALVRRRGRSVPGELGAIDWVEAADDCVRLDLVAEVRADADGTCVLLRDGTRLPLSRRRRLLLEQRLRG